MAVVEVQHMREGRSGQLNFLDRSFTELYRVRLDSHTDMVRLALSADDGVRAVPLIYSAYPTDAGTIVLTKDAAQVGKEPVMIITVKWGTPKTRDRESPFDDPAIVQWGWATNNAVVEKDVDTGKPVNSSAGEVLVPGLEQEKYNLTLTVTRNFNTFDELYAATFVGKTNSDTVDIEGTNWFPDRVLCRDYSADYLVRNGTDYYAVTQEFEFQSGGWGREIIDQGTYYRDASGNKHLFKDAGEKSAVVGNLNGSGRKLPAGNNAVFLTYATREQRTFTPLDLGNLT